MHQLFEVSVDDAGFGRVRAVGQFVYKVAKTERLILGMCMWFGPVNEGTYVHVCV